ncbi:hypothetical protein BLS_000961 [Venturia inaequalis]|uniref:Uncharacterized protein n=2 Tax=Venturia inaequalis TaxID=5025 RepID=A0A8H3VQF7_VENIN|nr:hypothetical protein BLS_000961 [Venturia inaequalis]KAE9991657.1 hypothetical protein EG327_011278 [Venturia inaequalis]
MAPGKRSAHDMTPESSAHALAPRKRAAHVTAPNNRPTSFLTLARELRQAILLQTYDLTKRPVTKGQWVCYNHKSDIEDWIRKLHIAVQVAEIKEDIDYVKAKWLFQLDERKRRHEECFESVWTSKSPMARISNWKITRYDDAPWLRVHIHLDEMDRLWFENHGGAQAWFGPKSHHGWMSLGIGRRIVAVRPPWQEDRRVSTLANEYEGPWKQGPSGVEWSLGAHTHPPSTWNALEIAAAKDIKWLTKEAEKFQKGFFPEAEDERIRPRLRRKIFKQIQKGRT